MSYDTADLSVADGSPIEVFKFIGTGVTYRYTNADLAVTVDGEEYLPLNISRSTIEVGSVVDSVQTIDIEVPIDSDLAQLFVLLKTRDQLDVEIRRVHRGTDYSTEFELVWKGYTLFYSASGRTATIQTGTIIQAALSGSLNTIYFQSTCNHVLYDGRCGLDAADFTTTSHVTAIDVDRIYVDNSGVDNNDLRAGEMIVTRTGERRFVMGNALDYVDVGYEFVDLQVGDEVTMIQGCSHSIAECKTKFDNVDQFGGFLYVPTSNPFNGEL